MQAVKKCGAELIDYYNIIKCLAVKITQSMTMPEAIQYFKKVKDVIDVERD